MKLGLENITNLLDHLGNPQNNYPAVIVGGTNGKGSVTAFISSILRASGLAVGTFFSPHLFRVNERIGINGEEIPSPELDDILGELRPLHDKIPFTFFEGLTAAAVLYFDRKDVDIAVFEVGLGGRLDATRLVNAAVTVITGISYDHREHLGKTRASILDEKLGITRTGVPLVANLQRVSLAERARRHCMREGIPFCCVTDGTVVKIETLEPDGMDVRLVTPKRDYGVMRTKMIGKVQAVNVGTAVNAVEALHDCAGGAYPRGYEGNGLGRFNDRNPESAVRKGLRKAFAPGRFQVISDAPRIILDVSHNEEALLASLDTLRAISARRRNVIVFGVLARKELGVFPSRMGRAARDIIFAPLRCKGGAGKGELAQYAKAAGESGGTSGCSIRIARGVADAMRTANRLLGRNDTLLVLGSHRTVEKAAAYI